MVADQQAGGAELGPSSDRLPPAARLQILTTEHWSLLSTRALSWNEAFSRASMFLSALSGGVIALALVAQATSFDDRFTAFALLLLTPILLLGIATFVKLIEINREDARWVIGMNLLRHAYLEAAPELRPYFVTGWHDDEAGIMTTFGATAGPGGFRHEFVTTPGVLAVVDGTLAGALVAMLGGRTDVGAPISMGIGVVAFAITVALLSVFQYRRVVRPRGLDHARFPKGQADVDLLQGPWSGRLP